MSTQEQIFQDLYDKTYVKLFHFAMKYTKSAAIAKDRQQTAYLKVWEKRNFIKPEYSAFKSYLFKTVKNLGIKDYYRRVAENQSILQYYRLQQFQTINDSQKLIPQIYKIVAQLPNKQQQAFRLVKFEGLTYQEAADELAISKSTIEKHMIKALRTLRSSLHVTNRPTV